MALYSVWSSGPRILACHTKVYLSLRDFELSQSWKLEGQTPYLPHM